MLVTCLRYEFRTLVAWMQKRPWLSMMTFRSFGASERDGDGETRCMIRVILSFFLCTALQSCSIVAREEVHSFADGAGRGGLAPDNWKGRSQDLGRTRAAVTLGGECLFFFFGLLVAIVTLALFCFGPL